MTNVRVPLGVEDAISLPVVMYNPYREDLRIVDAVALGPDLRLTLPEVKRMFPPSSLCACVV